MIISLLFDVCKRGYRAPEPVPRAREPRRSACAPAHRALAVGPEAAPKHSPACPAMPRPGTPPPDTGVGRPSPSRRSATLLPPFARWWSPTGAAAVALLLLLAAATTGPLPLAASRLTVTSPRARQLPPQLALKPRLFQKMPGQDGCPLKLLA